MVEQTVRLNIRRFRSWLEGQESGAVVGERKEANHCPIAMYLQAELGEQWASVGNEPGWWSSEHVKERRLSRWALRFVVRVDAIRTPWVTARKALSILDGVEALAVLERC